MIEISLDSQGTRGKLSLNGGGQAYSFHTGSLDSSPVNGPESLRTTRATQTEPGRRSGRKSSVAGESESRDSDDILRPA